MLRRRQYIITHKHCRDGQLASLAAYLIYREHAHYLEAAYGDALPGVPFDGSDVAILDFSYSLQTLNSLADRVNHLTIIDHHAFSQAAIDAMRGRSNVTAIHDQAHSGAYLAWRYYHGRALEALFGEQKVPLLVRYVEDRDLWKFQLPRSQEINAGLSIIPFDRSRWTRYVRPIRGRLFLLKCAVLGTIVLRVREGLVRAQTRGHYLVRMAGYVVPVVNATVQLSEVGHAVLDAFPEASFVGIYHDLPGGRRAWALRSRNPHGVDVSLVARTLGGGGHKHAAGFVEVLGDADQARRLWGDEGLTLELAAMRQLEAAREVGRGAEGAA